MQAVSAKQNIGFASSLSVPNNHSAKVIMSAFWKPAGIPGIFVISATEIKKKTPPNNNSLLPA